MKKLRNQTQYEAAVRRVEELLPLVDDDTPLDNPYLRELEDLSNAVAVYSDEHFTISDNK